MFTKGYMTKKLKEAGIRRTQEGKKLEAAKTYEITKLYYNTFGGFNN